MRREATALEDAIREREGAKDGRAAALAHAGSRDLSDAGAPELPEDDRGGRLRRRWHPRQSDDLPRHLRHAWSGGPATLSYAALPAVTNPFSHASVLAGASRRSKRSPRQTKVIIGSGYTSASTIGRKPATLEEMRRCVSTVNTLLAGEAVDFGDKRARLGYASGRRIPVLMAASDRRRSSSPQDRRRRDAPSRLQPRYRREGARPSRARCGSLRAAARGPGGDLGGPHWDGGEHGRGATAGAPCRRALGLPRLRRPWLAAAGLDLPKLEIPQAAREVYPDLSHAEDWNAAIAATLSFRTRSSAGSAMRSASSALRRIAPGGSSRRRASASATST